MGFENKLQGLLVSSTIKDKAMSNEPTLESNQTKMGRNKLVRTPRQDELSFVSKFDHGNISTFEKVKSLVKGVISPITSMFSSVKNFAVGTAMIAGSTALCIATGGAAAPVLVVMGIVTGGFQIIHGLSKATTADTNEGAKQAWEEMGAGISSLGLSALGAKASLASSETLGVGSAIKIKNMSLKESTMANFKQLPKSLTESYNAFKSGKAVSRITNFATGKTPVVAIIDNYETKTINIDGSGVKDLSHGELVQSIVESTRPGTKIISINDRTGTNTYKENVITAFNKLAEQIKNGEQIDAVNLSSGDDFPIDGLARETGLPLTPGNISEYRSAIREWIKNPVPSEIANYTPKQKTNIISFYNEKNEILEAIEAVTKKGVKVNISGSNGGPNSLNLNTFAEGVDGIGATNYIGEKTSYTPIHSMITRYRQGTFNVTPIEENGILKGYDITGSGKVEIPVSKAGGRVPISDKFTGKIAKELIVSDTEFDDIVAAEALFREFINDKKIGKIPKEAKFDLKEFLPIDKLKNKLIPPEKMERYFKAKGWTDYSSKYEGKYTNYIGQDTYFSVDSAGKLIYKIDADGSGRKAVSSISGTSFSTPRDIGFYVLKEYPTIEGAKQATINVLGPMGSIDNFISADKKK